MRLTRKQIVKLHQVFGHCHPTKLKPFLQRSGHWSEEVCERPEQITDKVPQLSLHRVDTCKDDNHCEEEQGVHCVTTQT